MIYEIIDMKVDVQRLRQHVEQVVLPIGPSTEGATGSGTYGGWGVLTQTGRWSTGWEKWHTCYTETRRGKIFNYRRAKEIGLRAEFSHDRPTEICTGYLKGIIDEIAARGLYPRRARISLLEPGGQSSLHRDSADNVYAARLHIPIITSPECTFWTEEGEVHLPADGSVYLLWVNRLHQIFNRGTERRYHLIMQIWDTRPISKHFAYTGGINAVANRAKGFDALIERS